MIFDKALTEALQVTVLKGFYNPSGLKPVQSTLERSSISVDPVDEPPAGAYSNLRREKVKLSDSLIREAVPAAPPPAPGGDESGVFDLNDPTGGPEDEPDTLQDPTEEPGLDDEDTISGGEGSEGGEGGEGLSSGSNYTVEMVKSQLDGILKMWMDLAGNYPEGDERHKFIEIGERLREISGVVERDFVQKHPD